MAEPKMTEAQKRAAARKAKILARGNAGLQRLAQTARGEEAEKLYGEDTTAHAAASSTPSSSAPASRPQTPVTATSTATAGTSGTAGTAGTSSSAKKTPGWVPPSPTATGNRPAFPGPSAGAAPGQPSPEEMQAQFDAMMRMLGGGAGAPGAGAEGMPDMSNLFAQLMGGVPPPSGSPGPNLLSDGSGLGTPNHMEPGANPFAGMDPSANPFAGMPGLGAGFPGFPGMQPPQPPSKAARFFPLIHAIAVIALVVFVAAWWEPTLSIVRWAGKPGLKNWALRWSSLAGRTGSFGVKSVEPMPVFYAFVTLEAILFATRVTLVQTPPGLHPLLANVLPMLPPNISRLVTTGSKYLGVASQVYADGCLFVFGLGCAIVLAEYLAK